MLRWDKAWRFPISVDMVPTKSFALKPIKVRFEALNNDLGRGPVNLFPPTRNISRLEKAMPSGRLPEKLFSWISNRQMAETLCRLEKGPHLANGSHAWIENEAEKVDQDGRERCPQNCNVPSRES